MITSSNALAINAHSSFSAVHYSTLNKIVVTQSNGVGSNTTDFGIMFLPIEGLFAEVLREPGIMETLRHKYKIALTGPTTLSALLNSLQMGFRTLLVQERSSEVWNILAGVKAEFSTFGSHLSKVQSQLSKASSSLESLRGTRTRAMERKLRDVEMIDSNTSNKVLELPEDEETDEDS